MNIIEKVSRYTVGVIALLFLNVIAILYDGSWLNVAVALDIAVVGAYLSLSFKSNSDRKKKNGSEE